MALFGKVHMPSLDGATAWVGSDPMGPEDLRGHVVVVDFWTLTCINWLRTEPYLRAWAQAYRDDGLIVLGVHTPEFSFEHDVDRVRRAVADRSIDYPVIVDNDFGVWDAFANHYWPALYFVDAEGVIRDQHFGEGRYERSEREIQRLLGIDRPLVGPDAGAAAVAAGTVEAEADWDDLRTPETYAGYARGERFASPGGALFDERRTYDLPDRLHLDQWALAGDWTIGPETVAVDEAGGSVAFRFHARDAHVVLGPPAGGEPIAFRVRLDGAAPGDAAGLDVDAEGRGVLHDGGLHQLIRQPGPIDDRTVEIAFDAPGAGICSFTFG
jgi:thiol-disulfide isomerase/thioredoxin